MNERKNKCSPLIDLLLFNPHTGSLRITALIKLKLSRFKSVGSVERISGELEVDWLDWKDSGAQ